MYVHMEPIHIIAFKPLEADYVSFRLFINQDIIARNSGEFQSELQFLWNRCALEKDEKLSPGAKKLKDFLLSKKVARFTEEEEKESIKNAEHIKALHKY